MTQPPRDIKAVRAERALDITWPDLGVVRYPFRFLRGRCSCAACVDEFSGRRLVGESDVAEDVSVAGLDPVGSYAVKITWSDGHATGLYTWETLRKLATELSG